MENFIRSKRFILCSIFLMTTIPAAISTRLSQREASHTHLRLTHENTGMLEVIKGKFYGHVCYGNWTHENSIVACRHLGYSGVERTNAMIGENEKMPHREIYLHNVRCNGTETNLWECNNTEVGVFTDTCSPSHVVWLACYNDQNGTVDTTTVPVSIFREPPPPDVIRFTSHSVSLSWEEWYDAAKIDLPEEFVISFRIMFRQYGVPHRNFTMGAYVPGYLRYGTVHDGLSERTTYEFKIVVMTLAGSAVGEIVGLVSPVVVATTTCIGPLPVRDMGLSVDPGSAHQVTVSWRLFVDEDCSPESFIVEYKLMNLEQCHDNSRRGLAGTVRTDASPLVLDELHPYSTYTINITSVNQFGRSPEVSSTVVTNQDVPSGTPINITTEYHATQDSLVAMWMLPACGERYGDIVGYTYMLLDVETDHVIHSGSTQLNIQHLLNVDRLRKYKFLVAAKTSAGMGPYGASSVVGQPDIAEICGQTQHMTTRIFGGSKSTQGDYPWIAQLWLVHEGTQYCTGSILDEYWILTAAHCIKNHNVTRHDIRIQVGDYDSLLPEPQQRVYNVAQIEPHVGFNMDEFDDDIAMIRVTEPIEFSDYIKPICLPDKKLARLLLRPGSDHSGTVSGWGQERRDGGQDQMPRYLKHIILPLVERSVCKKATNFTFSSNMFCAGYTVAGNGDICRGDSGAPFMVRKYQKTFVTGIVSWANHGVCDAADDNYGYYTRLFKYMSWIKKIHPNIVIWKSPR